MKVRVVSRSPVESQDCVYFAEDTKIPKQYVETLECGCTREVRIGRHPNGQSVTLRPRQLNAALMSNRSFDVMKHLSPKIRDCRVHDVTVLPDRKVWMLRMRDFNAHLRERAKSRGLNM